MDHLYWIIHPGLTSGDQGEYTQSGDHTQSVDQAQSENLVQLYYT